MSDNPTLLEGESDDSELFDDQSRYLDRFGLLLILVAAMIVIASLVHLPHESDVITNIGVMLLAIVTSLVLLLAIHASGVSRRWRRISGIAIGLLLVLQATLGVLALLGYATEQDAAPRVPPIGALLFALVSFWLVVRRVLHHRHVTESTVLAAVSGYLLIPIIFFDIFLSMEIVRPNSFFTSAEASPEFMYYSLTTVTTLGGALEAASDLGRLLTASASVIGQLYLVVFVALIVGTMASRWSQRPSGAVDKRQTVSQRRPCSSSQAATRRIPSSRSTAGS